MEDAALLRPQSGPPLTFTVDFITPIVDEPEAFGAIAAANSVSDVYAMGGDPQVALAICGFPEDRIGPEILERIFRGGQQKAAEAGCAVVGGHTVIDPELKYGLCVLGTVGPEQILSQANARVGDRLVLTKPIGTGIAAQAIKAGKLADRDVEELIASMSALNRSAKDAALAAGARAATDVTGFGLLGHLYNMLMAAGVGARIDARAVPIFACARALAEQGLVPGGTRRNLVYVEPQLLAIGLVSIGRSDQRGTIGASLLYGLGGAIGIGMLLLCLSRTSDDSGLWPVVAARGSGFAALAVVIAATSVRAAVPRPVVPHIIAIAVLITAGNTMFLAATRVGSTSVAAVLTSLFPAVTVFWAWIVFREPLRAIQLVGLAVALVAVSLIAAG